MPLSILSLNDSLRTTDLGNGTTATSETTLTTAPTTITTTTTTNTNTTTIIADISNSSDTSDTSSSRQAMCNSAKVFLYLSCVAFLCAFLFFGQIFSLDVQDEPKLALDEKEGFPQPEFYFGRLDRGPIKRRIVPGSRNNTEILVRERLKNVTTSTTTTTTTTNPTPSPPSTDSPISASSSAPSPSSSPSSSSSSESSSSEPSVSSETQPPPKPTPTVSSPAPSSAASEEPAKPSVANIVTTTSTAGPSSSSSESVSSSVSSISSSSSETPSSSGPSTTTTTPTTTTTTTVAPPSEEPSSPSPPSPSSIASDGPVGTTARTTIPTSPVPSTTTSLPPITRRKPQIPGGSGGIISNIPSNAFKIFKNRTTVCYGVLGCFARLKFRDLHRPINFSPQSPERINITYKIFTGKNLDKPDTLDFDVSKDELMKSHFNASKPTKFIVHGFLEKLDDIHWMEELKNVILETAPNDYNVITVDWSSGSVTMYHQAVADTKVVGAAIAYFITKLVEYSQVKVNEIHLIGHSLGSHIAGYVGRKFSDPQIGRITALDPAGPSFQANETRLLKLSSKDAKYVDAIHTDYGNNQIEGFGIEEELAHDDFYPNSGFGQPGCQVTKGVHNVMEDGHYEGLERAVSCNHQRAVQLALVGPKDVNEDCQLVGYACKSYEDFEKGLCSNCGPDGDNCAVFNVLGSKDPLITFNYWAGQEERATLRGSNERRKLFFRTSGEKPFCLHHYQIVVSMEYYSFSVTGTLSMDLIGTKSNQSDVTISQLLYSFEPRQTYTHLETLPKSLGRVEKVRVRWNFGGIQRRHGASSGEAQFQPPIAIEAIEINYLSNIDKTVRKAQSTTLCPRSTDDGLDNNEAEIFELC